MKRILLFLCAIVALNVANATTILFAVDMTGKTVHANGMHIAGSFQSPAWSPSATACANIPTTQVYYYSLVTTTPGLIEYKFINGNDWNSAAGVAENVPNDAQVGGGNTNRWYLVDTSMTKDTVLVSWEALTSAAFAPFGYNKQYVRLRVNMAKTTTIDPLVLVAGDFNGWSDKSKMLNLVTSGKVYEAQMWLSAGTFGYKFKNGPSGWESVPGTCATAGNRTVVVATAAQVLTPVCMNECGNCILNLPKYNVTFKTDISEDVACGSIDSVDVTGGNPLLGNWGSPGQKMTKVGATNVYTLTINAFDSGTSIEYKYRVWSKGNVSWEQVGWTSNGNRAMVIVSDSTVAVNCFGKNTACTTPPAISKVTFKVDFAGTTITPSTQIYLVGKGNNSWLKGATGGKIAMNPVSGTGGKAYEVTIDSICPGTLYYAFANDATEETYDTAASQRTCLSASGIGYQRVYDRPAGASTVYYIFGKCLKGFSAINYNGKNEDFRMYPNPMTNVTTIEVGSNTYTVNIIDITGKVVRSYNDVTGKLTINKGDLSTGIYIVDVIGANSRTTEKLSIR